MVGGTSYSFVYPTGLALSGTTLYVTDPASAKHSMNPPYVFKIDTTSTSGSTFTASANNKVIGSFGSGVGQFIYPRGIAVDSTKNYVYVADESNYRIVRLDTNLTVTSWVALGTRGSGSGQFISPQTIAVDASSGHIYVVDSGNYWIVRMDDITGANWTQYGAQSGDPLSSVYPVWVAWDSANSVICVSDDTYVNVDTQTINGIQYTYPRYQIAEFQ